MPVPDSPPRPRRSALYMPGANARALEKARSLDVDVVILDLEDAVAPEAKQEARERVAQAVRTGGYGPRDVVVRVNGAGTPWFEDDLAAFAVAAAAGEGPDALLLPKIETAAGVREVAGRLADLGAPEALRLWAMIETPAAVLEAAGIAAAGRDPAARLDVLVLGTNDLAKETRARITPGRAPMLGWLSHCILAARTGGLDVLDGVWNDFRDLEGFTEECRQAAALGFDGKTLIHPSQIDPCHAAFTPPEAEIAEARDLIAAFDRPEHRGRGVIQIDGRMYERMHAEMARRTVALAEAIAARAGTH